MRDVFEIFIELSRAVPTPIGAVILFMVGLLAAFLVKLGLAGLLKLVRFNVLSEKTGFSEFLRKGHVTYTPAMLVGILGYWVVLIMTLFHIARLLDIGIATAVFNQAKDLLPMLLAALFVSIIGSIIVSFFSNFAMTLAGNAALPNAKLLSRLIKYGGNMVVVVIALDQVGLGRSVITSMFILFFGAVMLAFALAFGFGCKDLAKDALVRFLRNLREQEERGNDLEG